MRFLKASVLIVSLMLVACEGAVSPTEPEFIESSEVEALSGGDVPEFLQPEEGPEGDDSE